MKGKAVQQIPPLATLGRDDRTAALGRDDRDNRSEDKKVLPEVRDDVVGGEGGKVGGKFRRSGFHGQGEIADDETQ